MNIPGLLMKDILADVPGHVLAACLGAVLQVLFFSAFRLRGRHVARFFYNIWYVLNFIFTFIGKIGWKVFSSIGKVGMEILLFIGAVSLDAGELLGSAVMAVDEAVCSFFPLIFNECDKCGRPLKGRNKKCYHVDNDFDERSQLTISPSVVITDSAPFSVQYPIITPYHHHQSIRQNVICVCADCVYLRRLKQVITQVKAQALIKIQIQCPELDTVTIMTLINLIFDAIINELI